MDWIHCNLCYVQPNELPKRPYKLTSCGHIFCELCEKDEITECKICKNKCTEVKLTSELPKDIQFYFQDPEDVIEKLVKVADYQKRQRLRLVEARKLGVVKYQKAKAEIVRLKQEQADLLRKLEWCEKNFGPMTTLNEECPLSPLFQHQEASQAIRSEAANNQYCNQPPCCSRINLPQTSQSSGYRYTNQSATPGTSSDVFDSPASLPYTNQSATPGTSSDVFVSPASLPSRSMYNHGLPQQFRARLTPPMSRRKFSSASQKSGDTEKRHMIEGLLKCKRVQQEIYKYKKNHPGRQFNVVFTVKRRTVLKETFKKTEIKHEDTKFVYRP